MSQTNTPCPICLSLLLYYALLLNAAKAIMQGIGCKGLLWHWKCSWFFLQGSSKLCSRWLQQVCLVFFSHRICFCFSYYVLQLFVMLLDSVLLVLISLYIHFYFIFSTLCTQRTLSWYFVLNKEQDKILEQHKLMVRIQGIFSLVLLVILDWISFVLPLLYVHQLLLAHVLVSCNAGYGFT